MDLTRLKQAHTAVKAISGGPDGAAAWFSAYALSLSQENLADLAGTLGAGHAARRRGERGLGEEAVLVSPISERHPFAGCADTELIRIEGELGDVARYSSPFPVRST